MWDRKVVEKTMWSYSPLLAPLDMALTILSELLREFIVLMWTMIEDCFEMN
jgi:hypothetical protein